MRFSIIIPLFNRPGEIQELLESLSALTIEPQMGGFEVVVVEDGSTVRSKEIIDAFADKFPIKYLEKENEGPAVARNFGVEQSEGEWLLFLDSDTVVPSQWLQEVCRGIEGGTVDAFGGPDRAADDFSPLQKAINYSMTSFFTTGGIRGGRRSAEKFHPRSFNMGIRRDFFERVGGFSPLRFGEDIDLSIRLMKASARTTLLPTAWVYHKRRVDFRKFYRQVRASGSARVWLSRKHRGSLKMVHLLPLGFVFFVLLSVAGSYWTEWAYGPLGLWAGLICISSAVQNRGVEIGILSVVASFVQLWGYGIGFLCALFNSGRAAGKRHNEQKFYR